MWASYKCKLCKGEVSYFKSITKKKCATFIGKVQGYCQGELVEMDSITIEEIKRQHKKPYQHGKLNNTLN